MSDEPCSQNTQAAPLAPWWGCWTSVSPLQFPAPNPNSHGAHRSCCYWPAGSGHLAVHAEGHGTSGWSTRGHRYQLLPLWPWRPEDTAVPSHLHPSACGFIREHPSGGHCKRLSFTLSEKGQESRDMLSLNERSDLTMCPGLLLIIVGAGLSKEYNPRTAPQPPVSWLVGKHLVSGFLPPLLQPGKWLQEEQRPHCPGYGGSETSHPTAMCLCSKMFGCLP